MHSTVDEIADGIYRISTFVPDVAAPTGSRSTSSWSPPTSRCCSTPARGRCSRSSPRRWQRSPGRVAAVDHLRPRRGRRVRGHEHVARRRARRPGRLRRARLHGLAERPVRPSAAPAGGRRGARPRRQAGAPDLDASRAPRLGGAGAVRGDDGHAAVRRPVHAGRRRAGAHDRRRRRAGAWPPRACSTPRASPRTPRRRIRALGDLAPTTLAIMHGSSFQGDGRRALYDLAGELEDLRAAA